MSASALAGKRWSMAFSSCRHATSGDSLRSHASKCCSRVPMPFTLNVAILSVFMGSYNNAYGLLQTSRVHVPEQARGAGELLRLPRLREDAEVRQEAHEG